jgi:DNA-binding transcriptional ArsR family regulator
MSITLPLNAAQLAGTRFALSPVAEVVWTVWRRLRPRPHARRWLERSAREMDPGSRALLGALLPADHPYVADFLLPAPAGLRDPMTAFTERIANTDPELVDLHLDVALKDRPVIPDVVASFPSEEAYLAWRRPAPPVLADLMDRGARVVAKESAAALQSFFDVAIAPDWRLTESVLLDDIAYRADTIASSGVGTMIEGIGDALTWDGSSVQIKHSHDQMVDWPHNGPLLVPCTAGQTVSFRAPRATLTEDPQSPLIIFPARGTARLAERATAPPEAGSLAEVVGATRHDLLTRLDHPQSTQSLSLDTNMSMATVSYHLGILTKSGLVTKARRGRQVLYHRTSRGDALFTSSAA